MVPLFATFLGGILGAFLFSCIVGGLEGLFRPYPDDMQTWIWYAFPVGAIFGAFTGCAWGLSVIKKFTAAGTVALIPALLLGWPHGAAIWFSINHSGRPGISHAKHLVYAIAENGPGLLWALVLSALGIYWLFRKTKVPVG